MIGPPPPKMAYENLRRAFLSGRTCELCQAPDNLTVHHRLGKRGPARHDPATWTCLCWPCHWRMEMQALYPNPT